MIQWTDLYENPRRLTPTWGHYRIFAPEAYARVRSRRLVPIVLSEAANLAQHFPICWRARDGETDLCVLRSLLDDGPGHAVRPVPADGALPLVLRTFPLVATVPAGDGDEIWIDDAVADNPTDIGAPILTEDGRVSRGTAYRLRGLLAIRQSIDLTRQLSEALARGGFLEPWPLDFDLGSAGRRIRLDDLLVVRPSIFQGSALADLLRTFGVEAASFLTAHRISLFRTAVLLQAARTAVAKQTPSAGPEAPS